MGWIKGMDREQEHLLPERLEDYVGADNPVRFLDVFVDGLDLKGLGFVFPKHKPNDQGRPAYHPGLLLKLYIYGYLHQIRAGRKLKCECGRNLELMWLMGKLIPDYKTITSFRRRNPKALKGVLKEFTKICRKLELFGGQLIAIDGTKIKAQNAAGKNWSESKLKKQEKQIDEKLQEYFDALDAADKAEEQAQDLSASQLKEKIERLKQQQQTVRERLEKLEKEGGTQLSETDADSRSMRSNGKNVVGYNVQAAVDSKHHMIVASDVINKGNDQGQLAPMSREVKDILEIESAEVIADGGYVRCEDVRECQEMGMEPHLPRAKDPKGRFGKDQFKYNAQRDSYQCPNNQELSYSYNRTDKGRKLRCYLNQEACKTCELRTRCTKSSHRQISRWEHEERMDRMYAKVAANPETLSKRKGLVEHCMGALKWHLPGGFLIKGLERVEAEVSLAHMAYNFKRALAVVGMKKMMAVLG